MMSMGLSVWFSVDCVVETREAIEFEQIHSWHEPSHGQQYTATLKIDPSPETGY